MSATLGTITTDCPVCGQELHIPIECSGPTIGVAATISSLHVTIAADADYLVAHWLTHGPHDGEPLPQPLAA